MKLVDDATEMFHVSGRSLSSVPRGLYVDLLFPSRDDSIKKVDSISVKPTKGIEVKWRAITFPPRRKLLSPKYTGLLNLVSAYQVDRSVCEENCGGTDFDIGYRSKSLHFCKVYGICRKSCISQRECGDSTRCLPKIILCCMLILSGLVRSW